MPVEQLNTFIVATLLVSLRIAPALIFAPPFTLFRIPASIRLVLSLAIAAWLVHASPMQTVDQVDMALLPQAIVLELMTGILLGLSLQIAFAAIYLAGRTIDFQAGFGLALLADPTQQSRLPLVGSLLAYAAAMVFLAMNGLHELLFIWRSSVEFLPLGGFSGEFQLTAVLGLLSSAFVIAMGLAGLILLSLFLVDLTVAFLSRTLPQMNVLLLGFQVKSIAVLVLLPFVFSISGALFLRLVRLALESSPRLI